MADETLENKRIDQLPQSAGVTPGSYLPMWNAATGRTERIETDYFVNASSSQTFEWQSDTNYAEDEVVTFNALWYQALDANINIVPGTDEAIWLPIPRSPAGFVFWQAGAFVEDECHVLRNLDGYVQLFRLANGARPFVSTDFEVEYCAGDWDLMSERSYVGIEKAAHGLLLNEVITFKGGQWQKYADGDTPLGLVRIVVNTGAFIVLFFGAKVKLLLGLASGEMYYIQPDGTIGLTNTGIPALFAVSSSEAILLSFGFTSGPGPTPPADGLDYELDFEL
jgi:hypothetical protein